LELTTTGKALIVTLLFRLFFGGYLAGMDQYSFNDLESALTVLLIYSLMGIFAVLFLFGKKHGLLGIIGLDAIFVSLQTAFIIASLSQLTDAGLHAPSNNLEATVLMFVFSIITLILAIRIYRRKQTESNNIL
jgi:hypothetical protein